MSPRELLDEIKQDVETLRDIAVERSAHRRWMIVAFLAGVIQGFAAAWLVLR